MHDSSIMRILQRIADLTNDRKRQFLIQSTFLQDLSKVGSGDILHQEKIAVVEFTKVMNANNVGMIQSCQRACFASKAFGE